MDGEATRLLADIGGTNCRFALVDAAGGPLAAETLPVAGFATFEAALSRFLAGRPRPAAAAIAAAGPAEAGAIRLTNAAWTIRADAVAAALGGVRVGLFNDLEAVGFALPRLAAADLAAVAGGAPAGAARLPLLALNVGTGFGAALALPDRAGDWRVHAGEAGHMRFAAAGPEETRIAAAAHTYEDALSGRGFRLLQTLFPDPAERRRSFSGLLGRVAGDLALATGAWGGVYLCGGVLDDWRDNVDVGLFLERFCDKGPMRLRMQGVPVRRIVRPSPALLGLAHAPL